MGYAHHNNLSAVKDRQPSDRANRSLIATATIVALAALIACWFGTREVTNGIVNYEGRKSARDWAISFAHSLSEARSAQSAAPLRPYSAAASPERFTALDNAMFEGEIRSYRLYAPDGVIVASSQFEDIGTTAIDQTLEKIARHINNHEQPLYDNSGDFSAKSEWTATALAPLMRGPETIGIFEVTVDVSDRAKQLNRLRYIAFGTLAALLASIFGILGFSISRTLRKQRNAQQALAQSARQHRRILDEAPDSIVIHNMHEVLYVNEAAVTLHGASSREQLIGIDPTELVPEERRSEVAEYRRKTITHGRTRRSEKLGRRRLDGEVIETDSTGILIEWDEQPCILIQSRDMTVQRAAQREIAEREARLTAFLEHTRAMIFIKSLDGRMLLVNRQFEEFYGVTAAAVLGGEAYYPNNDHRTEQRAREDARVAITGKAESAEALIIRSDGVERMMRYEKFPIKDSAGKVVSIACISNDITDIQEREEQIRKSQGAAESAQAQLSAFLDNSPSGMYLKDSDRNVLMVNRAFEEFYGVTADEITGKPISAWRPGDLTDEVDTLEMAVLRLGETMDMEARIENADGEPRNIRITKFPVFSANGDIVGVGGVNTDVTDMRRQELEARENQARLAAYIDHIPMMVFLLDRDSRFLMVNSEFADFFGVTAQKVVGKIGHGKFSPEQHELYQAENREICDRQISVNRVIELQAHSGETRVIQQSKFPIVTGDDVPVAVGVIQHDITEQKNHERDLETAREAAEAANRTKSAFLANISHEIRTPMNGVFGMADLLANSPLSPDQRRYLNTIRRSGEALLGIINNVLDVSRIEAGEFVLDTDTFNLHDVITDATEIFAESAAGKGVFIGNRIAGDVPHRILSDSVRLRQVLINLLGNAVKFTDNGSVVIRAERVGGDDRRALIRFEVIDSGIGIDPEKLENLFKPFHQADTSITRKYGGSGLGLSISGRIVELMGGHIDVNSRPGAGSSFVFTVPMALDTSEKADPAPKGKALSGKRLLVVDSNPASRDLLSEFASDWNIAAVAVSNEEDARAAVVEAEQANQPFEVALIDIVASERDGLALADWIARRQDGDRTRLIGLAPFNWHHVSAVSVPTDLQNFVTKPIRWADLVHQIAGSGKAPTSSDGDQAYTEEPRDGGTFRTSYSARILLAEDNQVNQEIALEYLIRLGCSVMIAQNGNEAVAKFSEAAFDIVFMDIQMPEMDGIEATRRIRDIEAGAGSRRTPIIAATAHAFQEERNKCINAGMDDFLSKPFSVKDIELLLDRWLDRNASHTTAQSQTYQSPAARTGSPAQEVLDPGTIAQLRSLDGAGGDSILRKIAGIYVETTPPQLHQLQKHVLEGDCTGIVFIAHSLKTASANVAALALSKQFSALECAARDGDIATCREVTVEVTGMYEDVLEALRQASPVDIPNRKAG